MRGQLFSLKSNTAVKLIARNYALKVKTEKLLTTGLPLKTNVAHTSATSVGQVRLTSNGEGN